MLLQITRLLAPLLLLAAGLVEATTDKSPSWTKRNDAKSFAARNGHALAVFKEKLWVTGGRSEEYQQYNLQVSHRRGDVWSSDNGTVWVQYTNLTGDFYKQNHDAKSPGPLAPWWARFGHSLDTVEAMDRYANKLDEVLIQLGGYTPNPLNDIWVSVDGTDWRSAGRAPWSERAWHATTKLNGKLLVLGGTPLVNDVWQLDAVTQAPGTGIWYTTWTRLTAAAPWSPRVGHAVEVLQTAAGSTIYLTGGFAGWPRDSAEWDGERTRSDIWTSINGITWTQLTESAPWTPRGWHSLTTWSSLTDPTADVMPFNSRYSTLGRQARMWLAGGGYIGTRGNNVVKKMMSRMDMWWTVDGIDWHKVSNEDSSEDSSFMEWTFTDVGKSRVHLGRWGHRMIAWQDQVKVGNETETVPALYFVGGDAAGDGGLVNDVYVSASGLLCSEEGAICNDVGTCKGFSGCSCEDSRSGDFCQEGTSVKSGAAPQVQQRNGYISAYSWQVTSLVITLLLLLQS